MTFERIDCLCREQGHNWTNRGSVRAVHQTQCCQAPRQNGKRQGKNVLARLVFDVTFDLLSLIPLPGLIWESCFPQRIEAYPLACWNPCVFRSHQLSRSLKEKLLRFFSVNVVYLQVAEQLRCAGVIEAIRISRAAYPNRMTRKEFNKRYGVSYAPPFPPSLTSTYVIVEVLIGKVRLLRNL